MNLSELADQYLENIESLSIHLKSLEKELSETKNFELRRKLHEKINNHEAILRQTLHTYHYLKNYYNKNSSIKSWI